MSMWFTSMKEHRKHLESVVFKFSIATGHISTWVAVLCPDQRFQTKTLNSFLIFTNKLPFHAQK